MDLPVIDGRDIGEAMKCAAVSGNLDGYQSFNIVGKEVPTVKSVIVYIHEKFGCPKPHFSVPFSLAYPFAWLMEILVAVIQYRDARLIQKETRSISDWLISLSVTRHSSQR